MRKLICIGDSHASFFSGMDRIQPIYPELSDDRIEGLESVRLGAVLAYSLNRNNTKERGREKLFLKLESLNVDENAILFCFGEIDCRFHLLKQAEIKGQPLKEVIEDCVKKYIGVVQEVKELGFQVVVWNSIPTTYDNYNPEYPNYGTERQRNECTKLFNNILEVVCINSGILFIDIFDKLIYKNNSTKGYYLFDKVHLGQLAMPYFIEKIKHHFSYLRLNVPGKNTWYMKFALEFIKYKIRIVKKRFRK